MVSFNLVRELLTQLFNLIVLLECLTYQSFDVSDGILLATMAHVQSLLTHQGHVLVLVSDA